MEEDDSDFNSDEKNYKLCEVKFLGHLGRHGLKDTILSTKDPGPELNAECYVQLIQFSTTPGWFLGEQKKGKKALEILGSHYASQIIINLLHLWKPWPYSQGFPS